MHLKAFETKWNKVYSSYSSAFIQRAANMVPPAPGQYIMVYCFLGHADAVMLLYHLHILSVPSCSLAAYKHADGKKIDGRRVLVDVERGRTVKGWRPRRLGHHRPKPFNFTFTELHQFGKRICAIIIICEFLFTRWWFGWH